MAQPRPRAPLGDPWHLPPPVRRVRPRWWRRLPAVAGAAGLVGAALTLSVLTEGDLDLGFDLDLDPRRRREEPTVEQLLTAVVTGETVRAPAAAFGTARWCPRYHEIGRLLVASGTAAYDQGRSRDMDLVAFRPTAVHRGTVDAPIPLPDRWWVLELTGTDGTVGHLAAAPVVLAVLGAVASWPAPPGWDAARSLPLLG